MPPTDCRITILSLARVRNMLLSIPCSKHRAIKCFTEHWDVTSWVLRTLKNKAFQGFLVVKFMQCYNQSISIADTSQLDHSL